MLIVTAEFAIGCPVYTLTTFMFPGNAVTYGTSINDAGDIVGFYAHNNQMLRQGFLMEPNNHFQTIVYPSALPSQEGTIPKGINSSGEIVGWYQSPDGASYGFFDNQGVYTSLDPPGAGSFPSIRVAGVNASGEVVGTEDLNIFDVGFLYDNGVFSTVTVPGLNVLQITGINDEGDIVGIGLTATGTVAGFIDRDGYVTTTGSFLPEGINDSGEVVNSGSVNSGDVNISFSVYTNGSITTFKIPGADYIYIGGLNNKGQIVGAYHGSSCLGGQGDCGFLETPVSSSIPSEVPKAANHFADADLPEPAPSTLSGTGLLLIAAIYTLTRRTSRPQHHSPNSHR